MMRPAEARNQADAPRVPVPVRDAQDELRSVHSIRELIDYTVEISGVLADRLLSESRCRYLVLPRAFIAYHALALGFSLTEIAHWLRRHPSTLLESIKSRKARHPSLFDAAVTRMIVHRETQKLQRMFAMHARLRV